MPQSGILNRHPEVVLLPDVAFLEDDSRNPEESATPEQLPDDAFWGGRFQGRSIFPTALLRMNAARIVCLNCGFPRRTEALPRMNTARIVCLESPSAEA